MMDLFCVPWHNLFRDEVRARWVIFKIILHFLIFGEESRNGQARVEPNFQPQRFPTESVLTARQFRQKGID